MTSTEVTAIDTAGLHADAPGPAVSDDAERLRLGYFTLRVDQATARVLAAMDSARREVGPTSAEVADLTTATVPPNTYPPCSPI